MFGYYRLASAVPQLRIADVDYNVDRLIAGFREASETVSYTHLTLPTIA